jgi:signal transduction histidine kinase/ligand-binding sensor domain-containing protein
MLRTKLSLMFIFALFASASCYGLNPNFSVEDYNHTTWSVKDGLPAEISSIAQTPDGWLWLATLGGLYRFDGQRFERFTFSGDDVVRRSRINQVHAEPNGDLWLSYSIGGLSVLRKNGKLEHLADSIDSPMGPISAIAVDRDSSVWVGSRNGIFHFKESAWHQVATGPDWTATDGRSLLLDQYGRMWFSNAKETLLLDRATGKLERVGPAGAHGSLIVSPDGRIWAAGEQRIDQLDAPPVEKRLPRLSAVNHLESRWAGQFDRDGNLWSVRCPTGLCILRSPIRDETHNLSLVEQSPGTLLSQVELSSKGLNMIMEDREGNVWVASRSSLERFRENKLVPVRVPVSSGVFSMARDVDGAVWATEADTGTLRRLSMSGPSEAPELGFYSVVATDRDGALILASKTFIERRYRSEVSRIALPLGPDGRAVELTVIGMLDDGVTLWMASLQTGLMGYRDGQWKPRTAYNLPPRIFIPTAGAKGQLWLSLDDGNLSLYDNGKLTSYDAKRFGLASGIFAGETLVLSGSRGMGVLQHGKMEQLNASDPEVLQNVSGMVVTPDGDHWFNGGKGLVHVRKADWIAALADPQRNLRYELLDALEGYPGRAPLDNRLPSAVLDADGMVWIRGSGGIVRLDPRSVSPNLIRPVVSVLRARTSSRTYGAASELSLPAGTRAFNIEFTAPGLRRPEGLRFRYRLSEVDQQWQDAGKQRTAFYTNLGPGSYVFTVQAINEDGVPGAEDATMTVEIAPTVVQTLWFKLACALLLGLLLYGLYRYRLRVISSAMAKTITVRMHERERIARMLHDTILQSVQTIILRLDSLSSELPENSSIRGQLLTWLERADSAVARGRDQVHELRAGVDSDVLAILAETAVALEEVHPQVEFKLSLVGIPRPVPSKVCEELSEIGREAMRNAFRHSEATAVAADFCYAHDSVSLHVSDNGKGIDPTVLELGHRVGHWGLLGMRERATSIGGEVTIDSTPGKGTRVSAIVPLIDPLETAHKDSLLARLLRLVAVKRRPK